MFRPSRSSSGPPRKQIQELFGFSALWDPKCLHVSVTGAPVTVVLMTDAWYLFVCYDTSGWREREKNLHSVNVKLHYKNHDFHTYDDNKILPTKS